MQNYSGGFDSYSMCSTTTNMTSASIPASNDALTENPSISNVNPQTQEANADEEEIEYVMKSMESLRLKNPEQFATVLLNNKQILDMISKNEIKTKEDMTVFENLFQDIEDIDIDYLFWSAHKSIKKVSINLKNMKLIHFFIIKKGYRLTNKQIYHNFLNDFMASLKHLNFIDEENNDIYLYVSMFQMFINQGHADVNDNMNEMKNTPLHYAVIFNQFQLLLVLLSNSKVNVNAENVHGDTPMDMALKNIMVKDNSELNEEVCIILGKHKGTPNTMKNYFNEVFTVDNEEKIGG